MKKKLFTYALIFLGASVAYFPFRHLLKREANLLSTYVLLLTLIGIIWYSLETRGLRKISAENLELSFKPYLILVFRMISREGNQFFLYNIGNGPAVKVNIDDAAIEISDALTVHLKFICPPVLKKDEWLPIGISMVQGDRESQADNFDLGFITPPSATRSVPLTVRFQNLIGKEYSAPLEIGKGMAEASIFPR